jgi:hypothetical protein
MDSNFIENRLFFVKIDKNQSGLVLSVHKKSVGLI